MTNLPEHIRDYQDLAAYSHKSAVRLLALNAPAYVVAQLQADSATYAAEARSGLSELMVRESFRQLEDAIK